MCRICKVNYAKTDQVLKKDCSLKWIFLVCTSWNPNIRPKSCRKSASPLSKTSTEYKCQLRSNYAFWVHTPPAPAISEKYVTILEKEKKFDVLKFWREPQKFSTNFGYLLFRFHDILYRVEASLFLYAKVTWKVSG